MNQSECIEALERYASELDRILSRFVRTPESLTISQSDHARFKEISLELIDLFRDELIDGQLHAKTTASYFNDAVSNFYGTPSYRGVENVRGVVNAVLARVRRSTRCLKSAPISVADSSSAERVGALFKIGERFDLVAKQLRHRREGRETLDVHDEYDVQDLFHALLRIPFDDVRTEEWTPSYAGGAARMDFLLPEIEAVVEIKKSRSGLGAREVGEQLIIDIAKYKQHKACRTLFCFVYDPDGRIINPRGIENDLNTMQQDITVKVLISS